ncbi:MAG: DUF6600 domain-containing protein [Candidatus Tectimicrobiota bacterium]
MRRGRRYLAGLLCTAVLLSAGHAGRERQTPEAWAQEPQAWSEDDTLEDTFQGDVADVQVFYEPLAPYGRWTTLTEYGSVWIPHDVPAGWRPYMEGRWVYTRHGWTWVAEQPWGWAPFHYGRWAFVTYYGWVWIPGTVWGPAWVIWRVTPGWIGWAPLPPQAVFRAGIGLQTGYDESHIDPAWFCFVEERRLIAPHLATYIVPLSRNVVLLPLSTNATRYSVVQRRIINNGVPVERIEKATARPVPRMRLLTTRTPESRAGGRVRDRERAILLYRPEPHVPPHRPPVPGGQTSPPGLMPRPGTAAPGGTPRRLPAPQDIDRRRRELSTPDADTLPGAPIRQRPGRVFPEVPDRYPETPPTRRQPRPDLERQSLPRPPALTVPSPQQELSPAPRRPLRPPRELAPQTLPQGMPPAAGAPTERPAPVPGTTPSAPHRTVPQGRAPLTPRPGPAPSPYTPSQPSPSPRGTAPQPMPQPGTVPERRSYTGPSLQTPAPAVTPGSGARERFVPSTRPQPQPPARPAGEEPRDTRQTPARPPGHAAPGLAP